MSFFAPELRFKNRDHVPYVALCIPALLPNTADPTRISPYLDELRAHGITRVYLPSVSEANAAFAHVSALKGIMTIDGIDFCYDHKVSADGLYGLQPGDAFCMLAAGCSLGVVTMKDSKEILAFHASRESWIDPKRALCRAQPHRTHETVLHAATKVLRTYYDTSAGTAYLRVLFTIDVRDFAHDVNHPRWGSEYQSVYTYLEKELPGRQHLVREFEGVKHLDMAELSKAWAHMLGFGRAAAEKPLPRNGSRNFVHVRSELGKKGVRNITLVYLPRV